MLLLLVSLGATVLVAETYLRYRHRAWPFEEGIRSMPWLTLKDSNLRWRFPPKPERNSLGLLGHEIGEKRDDHLRVLFLGDSLVWSGVTSSDDLYTQVIERHLNDRRIAAGRQVEVINAGVPGYTTYQELEFLKTYGLDMRPDLVVLGFVFNDVYYKYLHRPTERNMLALEPGALLHRFDTRSFPGALVGSSYLAHELAYAVQVLARKVRRSPSFPFESKVDFYLAWKEYGWADTIPLIGELRELLKARGVPLMIVVFPVSTQVDDKYRSLNREYVLYPQRRIRRICSDHDIPCLDMTEALYVKGGTKLYRDYLHLNKQGNDVVAEEVTRYLVEKASLWVSARWARPGAGSPRRSRRRREARSGSGCQHSALG